jgi:ribosomal protein S18 acetylase RimI-like enzyme
VGVNGGSARVRIAPLASDDIDRVSALAREIWLEHYPGIISVGQIEYMLAQRYEPRVIAEELARAGLWWDKLTVGSELAGFSSYFLAEAPDAVKLDKLYVHARHRRRGCGGMLIARACEIVRREGRRRLVLAVNKHNAAAIAAYRKHGFAITDAIVKEIGGGYVMDDYVMEKTVNG